MQRVEYLSLISRHLYNMTYQFSHSHLYSASPYLYSPLLRLDPIPSQNQTTYIPLSAHMVHETTTIPIQHLNRPVESD
ncbi:hypothetical protein VKT23_017060 [Stygiomarasmius scandens]|uniref:Uncharacterized protein n=1 Tax=Marasmiellus scandens TaxID=2682957 RepID=A0ABR1IWH2_9AGAR